MHNCAHSQDNWVVGHTRVSNEISKEYQLRVRVNRSPHIVSYNFCVLSYLYLYRLSICNLLSLGAFICCLFKDVSNSYYTAQRRMTRGQYSKNWKVVEEAVLFYID
jgi:hypothetical protein